MSMKMDALIVGRDRCLMITPVSGIQNEGASRLTLEALISSLNISARNKKRLNLYRGRLKCIFIPIFGKLFNR